MIDIAWSEFLFVGILALILLGPKELPVVLRALGRWVGYLRGIAHDAQLYVESISQLPSPNEKAPSPLPPPINAEEIEGDEALDREEAAPK